ncbi:MAG: urease accessory protein UreD [Geminicoccaceae bacterium]
MPPCLTRPIATTRSGGTAKSLSAFPVAMPLERSEGRVELTFKRQGPLTVLDHLHQSGCGKARLPRPTDPAHAEAVLLNLAGGLTGGDRLAWQVVWQTGAVATVSSQAAEKIYRARGNSRAEIDTELRVAADALALWLPQATIFFDRARLVRRNCFAVARGGRLLAIEATIMGRQAMGETVAEGVFDERFEVRYGDRLILADRQLLRGSMADRLARPAVAAGATGLVTLLYVGETAAERLDTIRDALGPLAAATAPDPHLVLARWLTHEPRILHRELAAALLALQAAVGLPARLPNVWCC